MVRIETDYHFHVLNMHKLEDQYIGWIEYIAMKRGISIGSKQITKTDRGEDVIIELHSSDVEKIEKTVKSILKYRKTIERNIAQKGLRLSLDIEKEEVFGGVKLIISFILPQEIAEFGKKLHEEMEREKHEFDEIWKMLEEIRKKHEQN